MMRTSVITVRFESGEKEVLITPFSLQSKERPNLKSGKIEVLFFYIEMQDDNYWALLEKEVSPEQFKANEYIVNCGQDFEKYYLGSLHVDIDTKTFWQWECGSHELNDNDVKILGNSLFDPQHQSRQVTLFTPTRPSDFNFSGTSKLHYDF